LASRVSVSEFERFALEGFKGVLEDAIWDILLENK